MTRDIITIIDFGGQYAHLIANRIRRLGVYTEIVSNDVDPETLRNSKGIIFSGGPQSVNTDQSPHIDKKIFDLDIPLLGICYGHQMFGYYFGATIGRIPEYGKARLSIHDTTTLFQGCDDEMAVWENHGDALMTVPEGFRVIASTKDNEVAALQHSVYPWYSVQFHPEVTHSGDLGKHLFKNFVFDICQAKPSWNMEQYLQELRTEMRAFVGDRNVFLLVSGGVDSTVCFALLNDILGKERVFGLHIDNGCMRKNESNMVKQMMHERGFDNLEVYDAEEEFLSALKEKYAPEEKRKIIGKVYLDVKDKALEKYDLDPQHWLLAQGTIYPDTIESGGTKNSDTIKTHHNRVDQIQELIEKGLIVEPIKELYKDEVRELGRVLGLPDELVDRHPFPGPGLAIRALCSAKHEAQSTKLLQYSQLLHTLPLMSVGIKGDARSYAHPAVVVGEYDFEKFQTIMTDITNANREINRLIWLIADMNIEEGIIHEQYIDKAYMDTLREADNITMTALRDHNLMNIVWQCPTVIMPFGTQEKPYSIVIRPIDSIDAMSAQAVNLGEKVLREIAGSIQTTCPEIFAVFFDLTSKPPGTIEWE